jgi:hypothetical protein
MLLTDRPQHGGLKETKRNTKIESQPRHFFVLINFINGPQRISCSCSSSSSSSGLHTFLLTRLIHASNLLHLMDSTLLSHSPPVADDDSLSQFRSCHAACDRAQFCHNIEQGMSAISRDNRLLLPLPSPLLNHRCRRRRRYRSSSSNKRAVSDLCQQRAADGGDIAPRPTV